MKQCTPQHKLLLSLSLPALLIGCAGRGVVYQPPAPVIRAQPAPQALAKPPAPAPKPKPKVETYKLSTEPIIGEAINEPKQLEAAPAPAATTAPAPEPVVNEESAASAGYSAPPVDVSGSPAVLALMSDAERNSRSGNLDAAAGTVERALRIDSRNASLVYKLAQIRLQQNQPRLAEDLAKKAALLAENNIELKRNSWLLIAKARYMQGNKQGAAEARSKAERF
jgi:hypothetical protein